MHINKIQSIVLAMVIVYTSCPWNIVEAYSKNTNTNIITNTVGQLYEKQKTIIPKNYNLDEELDMPKEVKDDLKALYNIKYLKTKTSSKYEIALAYENGDYAYVDNSDDINAAIEMADNMQNKVKSNVIPVVINKDGVVVYATESIGKIVKIIDGRPVVEGDSDYSKYTANIYKTATSTSSFTYINHSYIDDAPIIENNGKRSKIQVNGITGWLDNEDAEGVNIISVPINQVKNLSYFEINENGSLNHYISFDIETEGNGNKRTIGLAPSFMEVGKKYYSYDAKYFYTNIEDVLNDLEENTNKRAINTNDPYYNYYTNIPARHQSIFSVNEINDYIANNAPSDSVLRNKGQAFLDAQEKYGVSANLILGVAMNESGRGTSKLAKEKNNIFGLNAVDSSPGQSADYFPSIDACIEDFAKNWMNNQYLNPKSWKYNGSNLGNKVAGINVMYASDPYWGEKAADFMHRMDRYISGRSNLIDYNRYQLGIYTSTDIVVDSNSNALYNIQSNRNSGAQIGDSLIVINESNGKTQLQPDRTVPINQDNPTIYDWNKKAYVNSSSVTFVNEKENMLREFNNFTVNDINTTATWVIGKGVTGATVKAYVGDKQIGTTSTVDINENYKIDIPRQSPGIKITVEINKLGYKETKKTITVLNVFNRFSVNELTSKSKEIIGKGVNGATVKVYVNGKQIGTTATVNSSGDYKISIPEQKSNTKITINMSKTGYQTAIKTTNVIAIVSNTKVNLTKDIYKYDIGSNNYLTYINGKGYSQFSYLNKSGKYAFTPSSWMKAAGLSITMPTSTNGYMMIINNDYIEMSKEAKDLLNKIKSNKILIEKARTQLSMIKNKEMKIETLTDTGSTGKASTKVSLTTDIYRYDAGEGRYLTYINGKGYSQYSYLNKSGKYAFTPSSWMNAAGLNITMPNSSNGYKMTITNKYVNEYNDLIKQIESYI
ncbi:glucosaminidase domain-containing protein [Romboutsia sp.]|uniref:glucosaminidase domain-containing protein n=1 Tax=Romboutsia sp. TaxID=1965302 RepID=UPI003F389421